MRTWLMLSAALLAPVTPAFAEDDAAGPPIVVTGHVHGYSASTAALGRTDTPLLDTPQSITVVTRERIDDQAMQSMGDVLRYVPGTTVNQGEGNRDQISLRGQNTSADFFLDGVRDDVQYFRSLYNIERVEVLKGPVALLFGRGGSGGAVNRVQKTPDLSAFRLGADGSVNSFGAWNLAADFNAPLGRDVALRVNGFYEELANHRDFYEGQRYAVNPYLAISRGNWQLGLSYEYVHDDRVADRGVPSVATGPGLPNRPVSGQRDTFVGVPGVNRTGLEAHIAKARLDGALTDNLTWSTTLLYGDYDKYYGNVFAAGPASADNGLVRLDDYTDAIRRRNLIGQTALVWKVSTGAIGHKVLVGLDYADQRSTNQRRVDTLSNPTFNLAQPVFPTLVRGGLTRDTTSDVTAFSAYAQDEISLGAHVTALVGLRYDRFTLTGNERAVTPRSFARTDETISPRFGLILKPQPNISVYGSLSRSFLPRSGDQFLSLTIVQANLAPERFTNYEVGAKWDIRPDLSATVALFQLDRTNATTPDPVDPTRTINIGETRTTGAEVGLTGRLLPHWQTSAAYTYQDGRLRGNDAVRLAQLPRHQLALWNRYDVTKAFGVGLGVVRQSSQYAAIRTIPTTTRLPGFTRVDAALYLRTAAGIDLQLNVENLLNTTYFSDAHNNNNISPGAPRNARLTARLRF